MDGLGIRGGVTIDGLWKDRLRMIKSHRLVGW